MPTGKKYWIEEGTFSNTLRNEDVDHDGIIDHYSFGILNKCLHAVHPLGWIRDMTVMVDSVVLPKSKVYFVLRNQWIRSDHVNTITDIWWYMMEEARIYCETQEGLSEGDHEISCVLDTSLVCNTRTVDRDDIWPRLPIRIATKLALQKGDRSV